MLPDDLHPLLAKAIEQLDEAVVITDAELDPPGPRILYVNAAFEEHTGYTLDELRGLTPRVLQGELTERSTMQELRQSLLGGGAHEGETWNYRKDGSIYLAQFKIRALTGDDGRITHYVAVQRDITEQARMHEASRRLEQAVEQASDAVLIFDTHGEVTYVNREMRRNWLRDGAHVLGTPVWRLPGLPVSHREFHWARAKLSQGEPWRRVVEVEAPGRPRRLANVGISPVRNGRGDVTGFVTVLRDHTQLERFKDIAEARNVSEQLDAVFAEIRHEIGNPVNSIGSALSVFDSEEEPLSERQRRYLESMRGEVERLRYLLTSLRRFGLFSTVQIAPLDLVPFVRDVGAMLELEAEDVGVRFDWTVMEEETPLRAWADRLSLMQALINLVTNGFEALSQRPDAHIRMRTGWHDDHPVIEVRDNGDGIPEDRWERVFLPFYTTKSGGTGLGLAVSRKIVTRMGGLLELFRPDDATLPGACFRITLDPVRPGDQERAR